MERGERREERGERREERVSPTFAALKSLSVSAYLRTYATIALKEAEGIAGGNPCMRCRSVSAHERTDAAHALEEEGGLGRIFFPNLDQSLVVCPPNFFTNLF